MTKPTSESEIKYKVPVWVVWSSIVLIIALSYALIYEQQENTQLKEQCGLSGIDVELFCYGIGDYPSFTQKIHFNSTEVYDNFEKNILPNINCEVTK